MCENVEVRGLRKLPQSPDCPCVWPEVVSLLQFCLVQSSFWGCSVKMMFLKISENSQENTVSESLFNKVAGLSTAALLKKRLQYSFFPVNFYENFRNTFFTEHLWTTGKKEHLFSEDLLMARSSRSQMFHNIGVLKYFVKLTVKQLHQNLFLINRVAGWTCQKDPVKGNFKNSFFIDLL